MSVVLPGGTGVDAARAAREDDRPIVEPRMPSAAERLEASRARLRTALMEIAHPPPKPSLLDNLDVGNFGRQILDRLKALPGVSLVVESVEHWWNEHPLRTAGALAEEASRRYVGPIARKNPGAIIVGGVVFGALLIASRPWRWLLRPAILFGLVPQIASHALKRMPLDSWLQMFAAVTGKRAAPKRQSATTPSAPTPASNLPQGS